MCSLIHLPMTPFFFEYICTLMHCEVIGPLYSVRQCPRNRVGKGVFADCNIDQGTFLFEYFGRQVHADLIDSVPGDIEYQWRLTNGFIIDGSIHGNDSRFINHFDGLWLSILDVVTNWFASCVLIGVAAVPNVEAFESDNLNGSKSVLLYSALDIKNGDQLLLDYGTDYENFNWRTKTVLRRSPRFSRS